MDTDKFNKYQELVNKYSRAFYRRVHDLFSLEDLAQEAWVCLLTLEKELPDDPRLKLRPFLVTSVRNHLINLIRREIMQKQIVSDEYDTVTDLVEDESEPNPEDEAIGEEQLKLLAGTVGHIRNGEFVLSKTMEGFTVREIAKLSKKGGLNLSRSTVNRIQHKLREEASKIFSK